MDEIMSFQEYPEKLMKAAEVAETLNISPGFAYRLMQRGKIRTVVMGRAKRVRPEDLQRYIESCLTPPMQVS